MGVEPWEYGGEQHVEWGEGRGGWLCNINEATLAPRKNCDLVGNKTSIAKNKECSCQRMISNWFYLLLDNDEMVASDVSDEKVVDDYSNDEVEDIKHRPNRWTKRKNHGKQNMGGLQSVRTIEPESLNVCAEDGNWKLLEAGRRTLASPPSCRRHCVRIEPFFPFIGHMLSIGHLVLYATATSSQ